MKNLNRILATAIAAAGLLGTALPAYAKLTAAEAARRESHQQGFRLQPIHQAWSNILIQLLQAGDGF